MHFPWMSESELIRLILVAPTCTGTQLHLEALHVENVTFSKFQMQTLTVYNKTMRRTQQQQTQQSCSKSLYYLFFFLLMSVKCHSTFSFLLNAVSFFIYLFLFCHSFSLLFIFLLLNLLPVLPVYYHKFDFFFFFFCGYALSAVRNWRE